MILEADDRDYEPRVVPLAPPPPVPKRRQWEDREYSGNGKDDGGILASPKTRDRVRELWLTVLHHAVRDALKNPSARSWIDPHSFNFCFVCNAAGFCPHYVARCMREVFDGRRSLPQFGEGVK